MYSVCRYPTPYVEGSKDRTLESINSTYMYYVHTRTYIDEGTSRKPSCGQDRQMNRQGKNEKIFAERLAEHKGLSPLAAEDSQMPLCKRTE